MQTALVDGKLAVASLIAREDWLELTKRQKAAPKDAPVITTTVDSSVAMHCKTSKDGFQFFSLYPKHHLPAEYRFLENESPEHQITKAWILGIARALGYKAECEVPIQISPVKKQIADTVIWFPEAQRRKPLVMEVQLSKQDAADYLRRTSDYQAAGYDCVWLDSRIKPSQCTHQLDPVAESELEEYDSIYSLHEAYSLSRSLLESMRWDGVEMTDGALRFPFRCEQKSFSFAVWYDHGWRDLALWIEDMLRISASLEPRPDLKYLRLCAAKRCPRCNSPRRVWLSEEMKEEIEYDDFLYCRPATGLNEVEKEAIFDFMTNLPNAARSNIQKSLLIQDSARYLRCVNCNLPLKSRELGDVIHGISRIKAVIPLTGSDDPGTLEAGWTAQRAWMSTRPSYYPRDDEDFKCQAVSISMMEEAARQIDDISKSDSSPSVLNLFLRKRVGWTPVGDDENQLDTWLKPLSPEIVDSAIKKAKKADRKFGFGTNARVVYWHREGEQSERYKMEILHDDSGCC